MIPVKAFIDEVSEIKNPLNDFKVVRKSLEKFERAKILEVYFARIDGRIPKEIDEDVRPLFDIELSKIKNFLLGQHPQDALLQRILKIMH